MFGLTQQSVLSSKDTKIDGKSGSRDSIYINGLKILQKREKVSFLFTLSLSLILVMMLFVILRIV